MKLIIKQGKKKTKVEKRKEKCYKTKCWNCGCRFIYQQEDCVLKLGFCPDMWYEVDCPNCEYIQQIHFRIRSFKPYKITTEDIK